MITIGNREVLFNRTFILPIGEEATFDTPIGPPGIRIVIKFESNPPDQGQPGATWVFADQVLRMTFKGWNNSLGTSLRKPAKLGDLADGRPFGFNIVHYLIGEVHFLTFELYAGGTY